VGFLEVQLDRGEGTDAVQDHRPDLFDRAHLGGVPVVVVPTPLLSGLDPTGARAAGFDWLPGTRLPTRPVVESPIASPARRLVERVSSALRRLVVLRLQGRGRRLTVLREGVLAEDGHG